MAVFEHAPSGVALLRGDGRFLRVNPALCVILGRTGVGLAVCRQILDRRGGSISVSSGGPGQGAAFTLRLPAAERSTGVD